MKMALWFGLTAFTALQIPLCLIAAEPTGSEVIGKVGDVNLTADQMNEALALPLYNQKNTIYQLQSSWVNQQAKEILYNKAAKEAKLTRKAWEAKELVAAAPTEAEIDDTVRKMGGNQMPTDPAKLATLRARATDYVTFQKKQQKEAEVFQRLSQATPVQVLLTPPTRPVVKVSKDSAVRGPEDAPVTIFEFTDFECPWCKRSQEQVEAAEKEFKGKIRLVDRMFPLQMHPRAWPAAEAAYCAKDQGKYWQYREKLFESSPKLEDVDLKRVAKEVGLRQSTFDQCMKDHTHRARIEADMAEGQAFGVRGTPAFFVNGNQVSFQQLSEAIRKELATAK